MTNTEIYKITNLINNKIYIGSACGFIWKYESEVNLG
jgi:hypothetical protein